ncbi:MAG: PD40 domain-containing protein [bacterium]|jgi:tricorn protease
MTFFRSIVASFVIAFIAAVPFNAGAVEVLGARLPQVSPDGTKVLFSYNGDLWTVPTTGGEAKRLTDNTAYERNGVWSPDGTKIAFCSNRRGNYDVYTMPAAGGAPVRLTYHDANDYVSGWSKGGKVLFYSFRNWRGFQLLEVPDHGGLAAPLTLDDMDTSYSCYTEEGDVVYARGTAEWYRKGYKGSGNYELWLLDRESLKSKRLTNYDGNDYYPAVGGGFVYFASDRGGVFDIYRMPLGGGDAVKVTDVGEDGATSPSVSADGRILVYENAGRLYRQDPAGGPASEIRITISSDEKENLLFKDVYRTTDEFKVSPNGKYVAFVARGDIYVVYTEDAFAPGTKPDRIIEKSRRVTSDPAREWQIWWHPNSDKLVYASDRNGGQQDLYIADLRTMSETRLTDSPKDDSWPKFSRDGKSVVYTRGVGEIVWLEIESHKSRVLDEGEISWGPYSGWYEFSPDDKWVAYLKFLDGFQDDLFLVKTDGSEKPVNVTRHPDWINEFTWVPDGSGIVFTSERSGESEIYLLELKKKEKKFTEGFILDPEEPAGSQQPAPNGEESAQAGADGGGEQAQSESPTVPEIKIDFDRIWERVRPLAQGYSSAVSARVSLDSKWVYFLVASGTGVDLVAANIEEGDVMPMGVGVPMGDMQFTANGDKIYFLDPGGSIGWVGVMGPQVTGMGGVPFVAEKKVDRRAELRQMYTECWRLLREQFYDPNLHGALKNWDAIYKKYLPLVEQAATPEEFNYIVFDLLGEIKGSHLGIYGSSSFEGIPEYSGMVGLDFDPNYSGDGLRVSHVLRDGPADRDESKIIEGEIVLSVNGNKVDSSRDPYEYFEDTPGDQVDLLVRSADGEERTVHLIPMESFGWYQLSYLEWVHQRAQMAEKLSDGKVGYLHIQGMDMPSLDKFKADLFGLNNDKDAVVIDVRFNGGGYTHDQVLSYLMWKTYGFAKVRGGQFYSQPAMSWKKPMCVLINGSSYSDAEIFPMAFKSLGLGKLVGVPTNGSVIGTIEWMLVDGTGFRLPLEGWFYSDKKNMEVSGTGGFGGVQPDILVENNPDDVRAGQDPQLEAAVRELLKEIR